MPRFINKFYFIIDMSTILYLGIYIQHIIEIVIWIMIGIRYLKMKLTIYKQAFLKAILTSYKKLKFKKTNLPLKFKFEIWRLKCTSL